MVCAVGSLPPLRNVVFGFPYLDTLKILRQPPLSAGAEFFANGDDRSLRALRQLLSTPDEAGSQLQAVFTEHPTNPLLQVPPLAALSEAAATARIPLIVDDTFTTPALSKPLAHGADRPRTRARSVVHARTSFKKLRT